MTRLATSVLPAVALIAGSCGPLQEGEGGYYLDELSLDGVEPGVWLLGTHVVVHGRGFVPPEAGAMTATITGSAGGREVAVKVDLAWEGAQQAGFIVVEELFEGYLPVDAGTMSGALTVERTGARIEAAQAETPLHVEVVSKLVPSVDGIGPPVVYPGERIEVTGHGFLLPGEGILGPGGPRIGSTVVRIHGTMSLADGKVRDLDAAIPMTVLDRNLAFFTLTPDIMGIEPGTFRGSVSVSNVFQGSVDTVQEDGQGLEGVEFVLGPPLLESIGPSPVRRGQVLEFQGRGFLGLDRQLGTLTFFTFVGSADGGPTRWIRTDPLILVPGAVLGNRRATLLIRTVEGPDGKPAGFGAAPMVLRGTFTPHVTSGDRTLAGEGLDTVLEVGRQVQVVYLRFMPTFRQGLERFGLGEVADLVRRRILEVCRGDYQEFSVDFRDEAPGDFAAYTTVEIVGSDPNGAGLLGLENTFGKDVWNLELDEVIGGYNAESAEAGYYSYGGVFVESFMGFSPSVGQEGMESPAFDEIFGPVAPELGGRAVGAGEYPGSDRDEVIEKAIRVAGNILGDTVSHEVGHALGLAAIEGDFHNHGDNPGAIMDAGVYRPFEERAQLPGADPRHFLRFNREYLLEILPLE